MCRHFWPVKRLIQLSDLCASTAADNCSCAWVSEDTIVSFSRIDASSTACFCWSSVLMACMAVISDRAVSSFCWRDAVVFCNSATVSLLCWISLSISLNFKIKGVPIFELESCIVSHGISSVEDIVMYAWAHAVHINFFNHPRVSAKYTAVRTRSVGQRTTVLRPAGARGPGR